VLLQWANAHSAYDRNRLGIIYPSWQGSLLEGNRDRSGLEDKRNRWYDPKTGQFTQEDPIGLAGGLNLYGFADGDPVNFSDPFGLQPGDCKGFWACLAGIGAMEWRGFVAGSDLTGLTPFDPDKGQGQFGFMVGKAASVLAGAGRVVSGGGAAGEATFFRGVSAVEAADVAATGGKLRAGAAAMGNEGKYLTNTVEAAAKWGAQHGAGSRVLRITVPADAARTFTRLGRIDAIGEAWWAHMNQLGGAKVTILP